MGRIALLSEALINKIAAGEVVERPASVLKELVENSVDAEARNVRVSLREGGLTHLAVTDDGVGMGREDAVLSLSRHATSKLRDTEGLFQILTKGFRGEALPAIASVSRLTLTTCERGAHVGTRVKVEGGKVLSVDEVGAAEGTEITVEDLFFSVPARLKFMRREQTELGHCEEALVRIALAHPEVGFFLEHEGRTVFSSAPCAGEPRERVAAALGKEAYPHLLPVDEQWLGIRVHGYIATAEFTLPTAKGLYCFVNHRYVRDRGLISAVQRGYLDTLPPGRQPVVVLFIEVDPAVVDVNVHPQKLEVRFSDARGVYDAVLATVSKAIRKTVSEQPTASGTGGWMSQAHYAEAVERFLARAGPGSAPHAGPLVAAEPAAPVWALPDGEVRGFGQALPDINEAAPPGFYSGLRFLGMLGKRFWICEARGGTLVVVCPHAALERVYLEEGERRLSEKAGGQPTLFRATFELPADMANRLAQKVELLGKVGVAFEPFGKNSFLVSQAPPWLAAADWAEVSSRLLEAMSGDEVHAVSSGLATLACLGAERTSTEREWSHDELREVWATLDAASFRLRARHGRIVVSQLPFLDLLRKADSIY